MKTQMSEHGFCKSPSNKSPSRSQTALANSRGPHAASEAHRRPKSAPGCFGSSGVSEPKRRRGGSAGRRLAALKAKTERKRPQSSPAMLRSFDGQRQMRPAHEDEFLQNIENCEVKRNMDVFKREKSVIKEKFDGVDLMADSYFYDLKVLHNGGQRVKTPHRRPESACSPAERARERAQTDTQTSSHSKQSLEATAAERMGELCGTMKGDLRRALRMREQFATADPRDRQELEAWMESEGLVLEDADTKKKRERQELLASFGGMFKTVQNECEAAYQPATSMGRSQSQLQADPEAPFFAEVQPLPLPGNEAHDELPAHGHRVSSKRTSSKTDASLTRASKHHLGELVGFLMGCCGTLGAAFRALDANKDQTLSSNEWEDGVMKLGFTDDVSYVFRLLGKSREEKATQAEIQALFQPFMKRAK